MWCNVKKFENKKCLSTQFYNYFILLTNLPEPNNYTFHNYYISLEKSKSNMQTYFIYLI